MMKLAGTTWQLWREAHAYAYNLAKDYNCGHPCGWAMIDEHGYGIDGPCVRYILADTGCI